MKMLDRQYFDEYSSQFDIDVHACLAQLNKSPLQADHFEYLIEASAVYSSNIEGNTMDVNSFMNTKQASGTKSKEFNEIVDLKKAYDFAREHPLTEQHLLEAHKILSRLILSPGNPGNQGTYRQNKVAVFSSRALQYMAVEHEHVPTEMKALFEAIDIVIAEKPDTQHALYFASLAHLNFAHIHPFMDGNGRVARLLEKWFLVTLIGDHAWQIES